MAIPVIIDIIAAAILLGFTISGAKRGLFRALAGLVMILLALFGARMAAEKLTVPAVELMRPVLEHRIETKLDAALGTQAASIAALTEQLDTKGNCQVYSTIYRGTGTYGSGNPTRLTFPKPPMALLITSGHGMGIFLRNGACFAVADAYTVATEVSTWSGNTVSWYNVVDARSQMNLDSFSYNVVALLDAET